MRSSQALQLVPGLNVENERSARSIVSWVRSCAAARWPVRRRAASYSVSMCGTAVASNPASSTGDDSLLSARADSPLLIQEPRGRPADSQARGRPWLPAPGPDPAQPPPPSQPPPRWRRRWRRRRDPDVRVAWVASSSPDADAAALAFALAAAGWLAARLAAASSTVGRSNRSTSIWLVE